jgi:hypothetical protein
MELDKRSEIPDLSRMDRALAFRIFSGQPKASISFAMVSGPTNGILSSVNQSRTLLLDTDVVSITCEFPPLMICCWFIN